MKLTIGQKYWILTKTNHSFRIGKNDYNALQECLLKDVVMTEPTEYNKKTPVYRFYPDPNKGKCYRLGYSLLPFYVFKSKDDYLVYIVKNINKMNKTAERFQNELKLQEPKYYYCDEFLKQKIKKSQIKNPEKWI